MDRDATTTITDMAHAAWWEVDLGREERIGWVKIVLPDPDHPKSRPECLRMQFPFWVFLYDENYFAKQRRVCKETGIADDATCPSRVSLAPVYGQNVMHGWKKTRRMRSIMDWASGIRRDLLVQGAGIRSAVRYIRIQHESGADSAYPDGKPLSLAEVSVLPLRLERGTSRGSMICTVWREQRPHS